MRTFSLDQINSNIEAKRFDTNYTMAKSRAEKQIIKRIRPRDKDEADSLIEITKATMNKAIKDGKFIIMPDRKIYYDPFG